ncbi:MAG: ribonuclease [Hyphomicrobiales bacterium]|nr:ribonuclease [Hyphomicrobiales bacterium]
MKRSFTMFTDAYFSFVDDDGWAIASHIALTTLMSMFPFLIFVTALAGFLGSKDLADMAASLLLQTWPEEVAGPIAREIHNVLTQSRGGLITIGAVLSLYLASSGVEAIRTGLNRAYAVRDKRAWWVLRLESFGFVLLGAIALLTLAFLVVLGPLIWAGLESHLPALEPLAGVVTTARYLLTVTVVGVVLIVAHKWLPAESHSVRQILPGVILTVALSLMFAIGFAAYLAQFARNYVTTYAGIASVMIALVFLYALASIFVFGGELNAAICRAKKRDGPLRF